MEDRFRSLLPAHLPKTECSMPDNLAVRYARKWREHKTNCDILGLFEVSLEYTMEPTRHYMLDYAAKIYMTYTTKLIEMEY